MSHSMYSLLSSPYSKNVSVIRGYSEGDKRHVEDLSGERVIGDVIQKGVTSVELEM